MTFLTVLFVAFFGAWVLPVRFGGRSVKEAARRALGLAFIVAGASHFGMPETFRAHLPSWIPFRDAIVYASGVAEIVGGLAVFAPRYRAQVGPVLAAYLVLIFPANVYVALYGVDVPGLPDAAWYHWARLPLQPFFVWWALRSTAPATPPERLPRVLAPVSAAR